MQTQRGITLVELLVTIAVFVILAMIGTSMAPMVRNAQLTVANNSLHAAINFARFKAVDDNAAFTLCAGSVNGCDVFASWSDGVAAVSATGDVVRVWGMPKGVFVLADRQSIRFDGMGMADAAANWVLCWPSRADERMTRLWLMPGGAVHLSEVDGCEL